MVPNRQKVWTDRKMDGQHQNYIPPTMSGDKNTCIPLNGNGLFQLIIERNSIRHYEMLPYAPHIILVFRRFTVCQSAYLAVTSIQRIKIHIIQYLCQ